MAHKGADRFDWVVLGLAVALCLPAMALPLFADEAPPAEETATTDPAAPAEPPGPAETAAPEPAPEPPAPPDPFQLAPADMGAERYDDLADGPIPPLPADWDTAAGIDEATYRTYTRDTKAAVDDTAAVHDGQNGAPVHQAWAGYSAAMAREAAIREAEYASGLAGISGVGVAP